MTIRKILLAGAALALGAPVQAPETIDVTLSSFSYAPRTISLVEGRAYVLRLTNSARGGHDFVARDFFAAATIAPEDRARLDDGGVEVPGGETLAIRLTAPRAGRYKVHCSHFMHSTFGMTGAILVS